MNRIISYMLSIPLFHKVVSEIYILRAKQLERQFEKRLEALPSFANLEEYRQYIQEIHYETVLHYFEIAKRKRKSFQILFDTLKIDFNGLSLLDLGTGGGDTLDIARDGGAIKVEFIEKDLYFFIYNKLKGYTGHSFNYLRGKGLTRLYPQKYDIIITKGALSADAFNRREPTMIFFPHWIKQLERLASDKSHVIICPTFDRGTKQIHDDSIENGSYYCCKNVEAFKKSWFSQTLLKRGYTMLFIEGFNHKERFPVTFYKKW